MSDRYSVIIQPELRKEIESRYFGFSNTSTRQARKWLEDY